MRFNRTNRVIVISMLVFFVMSMTIASVSAVPDSAGGMHPALVFRT